MLTVKTLDAPLEFGTYPETAEGYNAAEVKAREVFDSGACGVRRDGPDARKKRGVFVVNEKADTFFYITPTAEDSFPITEGDNA